MNMINQLLFYITYIIYKCIYYIFYIRKIEIDKEVISNPLAN